MFAIIVKFYRHACPQFFLYEASILVGWRNAFLIWIKNHSRAVDFERHELKSLFWR